MAARGHMPINFMCVCIMVLGCLPLSSQNGVTALMIASYCGYPSVVRVLLHAGAIVNTPTQVR